MLSLIRFFSMTGFLGIFLYLFYEIFSKALSLGFSALTTLEWFILAINLAMFGTIAHQLVKVKEDKETLDE